MEVLMKYQESSQPDMYIICNQVDTHLTKNDDIEKVYLGNWCLQGTCLDQHDNSLDICEYPWENRRKIVKDWHDLKTRKKEVLVILAEALNQFNNQSHDNRSWDILIGYWLTTFLDMLYERWLCVDLCYKTYKPQAYIHITNNSIKPPLDSSSFGQLLKQPYFNIRIYNDILALYEILPASRSIPSGNICKRSLLHRANSCAVKAKDTLVAIYSYATKLSSVNDQFLIQDTYMTRRQELKLHLRLGQYPKIYRRKKLTISREYIDDKSRNQLRIMLEEGLNTASESNYKSTPSFNKVIAELLPDYMPQSYLENYSLLKRAGDRHYPNNPTTIFTSSAHIEDDIFKIFTSNKVSQGARLFIGQHGGCYGTCLYNSNEQYQFDISDSVYGWGESYNEKVKTIGCFTKIHHLQTSPPKFNTRNKKILFVTATFPLQSYILLSVPISSLQLSEYQNSIANLIEGLPKELQNESIIRKYPEDYNGDPLYWEKRLPNIKIESAKKVKINDSFQDSRIIVTTYYSTSMLEAFSSGIPCLCFWDPRLWEYADYAKSDYKLLEDNGILFYDYREASTALTKIYHDVEAWWNYKERKKAIELFMDRHCKKIKDDPATVIAEALNPP